MSKSLEQIIKKFDRFWGVVSDPRLLNYYSRFGLDVVNNSKNKDGLCLITGDTKTFKKRH